MPLACTNAPAPRPPQSLWLGPRGSPRRACTPYWHPKYLSPQAPALKLRYSAPKRSYIGARLACIQEAQALLFIMLHVHDAKQECGSAQLVIPCLFILLFNVVVIGLLYMAHPNGCWPKLTFLPRPTPYPMRGPFALAYCCLYRLCAQASPCDFVCFPATFNSCEQAEWPSNTDLERFLDTFLPDGLVHVFSIFCDIRRNAMMPVLRMQMSLRIAWGCRMWCLRGTR